MPKNQRTSAPAGSAAGRPGTSRPARRARRSHDDGGFSLIEVLVSLSLFTIVAVSSTVALVTSAKYAESTDNRVVAAGLASAQIALARSTAGQPSLVSGTSTSTIDLNGATFTVERQIALTCAADHKRLITIKVSWVGVGAPVYADTVRSC